MKVLVIMGSPRKGNTYGAAEQIREIMQSFCDIEWEYLMLGDYDLSQCRGCFVCFDKGEEHCPIKDRAPEIEQRMLDADGVIFASPVYGMNVSGLMKTFVDRFAYIFHRPRFFEKKALLLATTGALGLRETLDYLDLVARVWGFDLAGRVGLATPPVTLPPYRQRENERTLQAGAEAFYRALRQSTRSPPGFKDIMIFHGQRASFSELMDLFPVDYAYWKEQGWLEKGAKYFVDVPVNPVYDAIGRLLEWRTRRQVRRDQAEAW
ncbi:MAG: flavodoxin family protein [Methanomicrobiaceae archaeon]|uniref:Iron-sulfur flavoprotein n=1 Tax=hydrocarbon metagenome TaxID=938273 RepID=A0A0W8FG69_9ZZZZ|nr:flavodoxin family protein [Methanomicrobiaceae archaeon]MDD5419589.1 flavodoxin family protein [Methanomicrobiaceae archaeon]